MEYGIDLRWPPMIMGNPLLVPCGSKREED
jgi:hypothetical protein